MNIILNNENTFWVLQNTGFLTDDEIGNGLRAARDELVVNAHLTDESFIVDCSDGYGHQNAGFVRVKSTDELFNLKNVEDRGVLDLFT